MTDFEKVIDFENMYMAYRRAKCGKGNKKSAARFSTSALDGVHLLIEQLRNKTYRVSEYTEFKVYEPKERIIKTTPFKDKVVQHSLCDNVILPKLQQVFIYDNCAGQKGKGTLFGLDRLSVQMKEFWKKYRHDGYILKCDVTKFFYSIPHEKLKDVVHYHFSYAELSEAEARRTARMRKLSASDEPTAKSEQEQLTADEDICWLCDLFIDSTEGLGIPLGNQINQGFALLYLDGMDHFIKGELGIEYYGRYMDDFYLIHPDKEYLKYCLEVLTEFLATLDLTFNGKTQIMPFKNGVNYLGFHTYVTENGKIIRKLKNQNKRNAQKKFVKMARLVRAGKLPMEKFDASYGAWRNHISHGNCYRLGKRMDERINEELGRRSNELYKANYKRMEENKMSYSYECPDCGANLDPGEACDCKKEKSALIREERPSVDVYNDNVSHEGEIVNEKEHQKTEMIIIEQLPIIKEQLALIKADVTAKVDAALAMPCTEDTVKEIKKLRTTLTKELTYWEEKRKFVKKAILAPYDAFDKEYKVNVSDIFNGGIGELKKKIDSVEEGLKKEKRQNAKAYFDEYAASKGGIDFIDFDRAGIVINLSVSEKKLKEQAKAFIDKICSDLALIATQQYKDEILYEYKKTLQIGEAVCIVAERHRALDEAEAKKAEDAAKAAEKEAAEAKVEKALAEDAFTAPVVTALSEEEKQYMVTFKVTDVLSKIKALKEFLEKEGINYEQL